MIWNAYGKVVGSKYLGQVEADTKEEAIDKVSSSASVNLCHQCCTECEDAEIYDVEAEEADSGQ